ncbi:hypothetical protein [Nostoc sp.]|uniref:hypothetical protein n=1 Tax=Nostoc sp. TaxID=1180 RepID=UPI002FF77D37
MADYLLVLLGFESEALKISPLVLLSVHLIWVYIPTAKRENLKTVLHNESVVRSLKYEPVDGFHSATKTDVGCYI